MKPSLEFRKRNSAKVVSVSSIVWKYYSCKDGELEGCRVDFSKSWVEWSWRVLVSHCLHGCEKDPRVGSSRVEENLWVIVRLVVKNIQELSRVELQRRAERTPFIPWRVSGGIISLSAHNRLYLYLYLHCIAFVLYCNVFHFIPWSLSGGIISCRRLLLAWRVPSGAWCWINLSVAILQILWH